MKTRLAISPIAWSNDDLPELGGDTPLETCLSDARVAGFSAVETGGKFPTTAEELGPILGAHGLSLASGWYSGAVLDAAEDLKQEKDKVAPQLELFGRLGAACIVYGETAGTIQNKRDVPLSRRRHITESECRSYGRRLTRFAEHCASAGVPLAFHHHMGTAVETEKDIDLLMKYTGDAVHLLIDTGHLRFARADVLRIIQKHGARIIHVHAKDVRLNVIEALDRNRRSFLDAVLEGSFTVPGDGDIDFGTVARRLADVGYEGWFVVEAEQDPVKAPPLQYAKTGHNTLSGALTDAGYEVTRT